MDKKTFPQCNHMFMAQRNWKTMTLDLQKQSNLLHLLNKCQQVQMSQRTRMNLELFLSLMLHF